MVRSGELLDGDEMLLETPHLIEEALASRIPLSVVVSTDAPANARALLPRLPDQTSVHEVPSKFFEQLTTMGNSRGILALAKAPAWREEDAFRSSQPIVVVVVGLQDAGNLGTILRTAEAFGASASLLAEGTVSPFNFKCIRAAAGALFRVPILRGLQLSAILTMLAQRRIPLFATVSSEGAPLPQAEAASEHRCRIWVGRSRLARRVVARWDCHLYSHGRACGVAERSGLRRDSALRNCQAASDRSRDTCRRPAAQLQTAAPRATMSLFANLEPDEKQSGPRPLADRMRPRTLDEFVGQQHLLGAGQAAARQIERDDLSSLILWGPPGVGKTTLAHIIAQITEAISSRSAPCSAASRKSKR